MKLFVNSQLVVAAESETESRGQRTENRTEKTLVRNRALCDAVDEVDEVEYEYVYELHSSIELNCVSLWRS